MTKSERQRRSREIIVESGADTEEYFNRTVKPMQQSGVTFGEQARVWFDHATSRKRKPVATATKLFWRGCLDNWLLPHLGDLPVSAVNNGAVKRLVPFMLEGGLSPKTITNYTQVVKSVVASAVNDDGEQLYPRKWNAEFIDLPLVEKSKQNTPSFTSAVMTGLAAWKYKQPQMLFVLCGATGMRIGEALGLEIDKHISDDFLTISIEQKARHCKIEDRVKTQASVRKVDLHPSIANLLKGSVGKRTNGFLFQSKKGKPLSSSNLLKRHLHPALKGLGYVNPITGTYKAGSHGFRRFRNTYLRNQTSCPEGLYRYWLGHSDGSMSERYDKVKDDVAFRRMWAEKSGIGFDLPANVPMIPKIDGIDEAGKAA